jgi:hypothetical protein
MGGTSSSCSLRFCSKFARSSEAAPKLVLGDGVPTSLLDTDSGVPAGVLSSEFGAEKNEPWGPGSEDQEGGPLGGSIAGCVSVVPVRLL